VHTTERLGTGGLTALESDVALGPWPRVGADNVGSGAELGERLKVHAAAIDWRWPGVTVRCNAVQVRSRGRLGLGLISEESGE
jgi:hypothetical protein